MLPSFSLAHFVVSDIKSIYVTLRNTLSTFLLTGGNKQDNCLERESVCVCVCVCACFSLLCHPHPPPSTPALFLWREQSSTRGQSKAGNWREQEKKKKTKKRCRCANPAALKDGGITLVVAVKLPLVIVVCDVAKEVEGSRQLLHHSHQAP